MQYGILVILNEDNTQNPIRVMFITYNALLIGCKPLIPKDSPMPLMSTPTTRKVVVFGYFPFYFFSFSSFFSHILPNLMCQVL